MQQWILQVAWFQAYVQCVHIIWLFTFRFALLLVVLWHMSVHHQLHEVHSALQNKDDATILDWPNRKHLSKNKHLFFFFKPFSFLYSGLILSASRSYRRNPARVMGKGKHPSFQKLIGWMETALKQMRIKTLIQGKRQDLRWRCLTTLHTNKYKQGVQEIKFDHLFNICHKRIRGMIDGINVDTESSASHHIHAVRSKHPAKREETAGQASGRARVHKMVVRPEMTHVWSQRRLQTKLKMIGLGSEIDLTDLLFYVKDSVCFYFPLK